MISEKQLKSAQKFKQLRDLICSEFEKIEQEYASNKKLKTSPKFKRKIWQRDDISVQDAGGGEMSIMHGRVFEKVGVNISTVHGKFSEEFRSQIPGTEKSSEFFATGISLVAHMKSPLVPAVHMNTRFISTGANASDKSWFGGGSDLNPAIEDIDQTKRFHEALKDACDQSDSSYYPKFKETCDKYFLIKHRNVSRGVGGIFFDYLNTGDFDKDFNFATSTTEAFAKIYPALVREKMMLPWTKKQKEVQLAKRGLYAEFNLLYDRGTKFGLMTGGNVEAILMSLPPVAKWK